MSVVLVASAAQAGSVSLGPARDSSVYSDAPANSNGIGPFLFGGNNGGGAPRRSLIAFDVAGAVPAGATITSATLTLEVLQLNESSPPSNFALFRATDDWGEGTSAAMGGAGAPATVGDTTWIDRVFPGVPWASPGGDFIGTSSADLVIGGLGSYVLGSTSAMVGDAQLWLDTPAGNFGWVIVGNEALAQTARRFGSRENGDPAVRPVLNLEFTTDPGEVTVPTVTEWGLIVMGLLILGAGALLFGRFSR